MRSFILKTIIFYQRWLSPHRFFVKNNQIESGEALAATSGCRFWPSCSEYARLCFESQPLYKAFLIVGWRLLRCGPWSLGGIDFPAKTVYKLNE